MVGWLYEHSRELLSNRASNVRAAATLDFAQTPPTTPFKIRFRTPRRSGDAWALVAFGHEDGRTPYIAPVGVNCGIACSLPPGHYEIRALYLSPKTSHTHVPLLLGIGSAYHPIMPGRLRPYQIVGRVPTGEDLAHLRETHPKGLPFKLPTHLPAARRQVEDLWSPDPDEWAGGGRASLGRASPGRARVDPYEILASPTPPDPPRSAAGPPRHVLSDDPFDAAQCYKCSRSGLRCTRCGKFRCVLHRDESCP